MDKKEKKLNYILWITIVLTLLGLILNILSIINNYSDNNNLYIISRFVSSTANLFFAITTFKLDKSKIDNRKKVFIVILGLINFINWR